MKKLAVLSILSLSVSLLVGCKNSTSPSKVYLPFGKLYDSSFAQEGNYDLENCTKKITHSELSSLISKRENFALVVYEKDNTCTCFKDFEKSLNKYLFAFNALVYSIDSSEFDGGHDVFGIKVTKGESTICLFERGSLVHQRVTEGSNDELLEYKNLAKWMNERLSLSKMLYVTSSQLDSLFEGDAEFTVGFLRSSCSDCAFVEKNVLFDYNSKKESNISYVIDCDDFEDNSFKNKYGLSQESNSDYGYGVGYVPTFVRYSPTAGSYADAIMDACVYLNDEISLVDGAYKVTRSYYSEERIPLLGFLGNSKENALIQGKTINEDEVLERNGNISWYKECAAEYHTPLLISFLDAYVSMTTKTI